jgi:hypothetical protein
MYIFTYLNVYAFNPRAKPLTSDALCGDYVLSYLAYVTTRRNHNSSVGTATGYGLNGRDFIPGRDKSFLFSVAFIPVLGPTQPSILGVPGALSPGIERQGREAHHSPPSKTKVKKGGAIPPFPHTSSWHSA